MKVLTPARPNAGRTRFVVASAILISLAMGTMAADHSAGGSRPVAVIPPLLGAGAPAPASSKTAGRAPTPAPVTSIPGAPVNVPAVPDTAPAPAQAAVAAPAPVDPPVVPEPAIPAPAVPASGNSADFSLTGYRWNPCQVVTVASSGPDVAGIVDELVAITGLHLTMVTGPADITVEFGSIAASEDMGLTSWRAVNGWLTQASIVISAQAQPFLATVLRHELAHALGLRHAAGADEVMYPGAGPNSPTDYQAGDLAGLRLVGASAGC